MVAVSLKKKREMGMVITALLLTSRVGAGIAAEVGTMTITEQIDALKTRLDGFEGYYKTLLDEIKDIKSKIKKAHCPEGIIKDNPILQIAQLIIFPRFEKFEIKRSEKFGGNLTFTDYNDLEKSFSEREVHPLDLKNAISEYLIRIINPIRKQFER